MRRVAVWLASNGAYWRAEWRDHDGQVQKQSLGAKAKLPQAQALRMVRQIELDLNTGVMAPGKAPTLKVFLEHHRRTRNVAARTAALQDHRIARYIVEHFGESRRMDKVTVADAQNWLAWVRSQRAGKKALSEHTVKGIVTLARMVWSRAGVLSRGLPNPFTGLQVQPMPAVVSVPPLSEADVLRLVDACPDDSWRVLVALCALGGLRRSEAMAMTWGRVDWGRGRLRVYQPKTARKRQASERDCLMVPALARVLEAAKPAKVKPDGLLAPVSTLNLHRDMKLWIRRAGLQPWPKPFHGLRAWRATTWREQRIPEAWIDAWLGHGPEVARLHYVAIPESAYCAPNPPPKP
jgi:integrase